MPARLSQLFDDYVEEIAVGTRPWVLLLLFGLGTPILSGIVARLMHQSHPERIDGAALLGGVLLGALLALVARERQRYRRAALNRADDIEALRRMPWTQFEIVVGEAIRHELRPVKERGGFRADGGIDLVVDSARKRVAVQAKRWRGSRRVGVGPVRELDSVVTRSRFDEGWLVTCGYFTRAAEDWATKARVRLVNGDQLAEMVAKARQATGEPPIHASAEQMSTVSPECPNCGDGLQRRTNSRDLSSFWACDACGWTFNDPPRAGQPPVCDRGHSMVKRRTKSGAEYWGCSAYPKCWRKRLLAL